MLMKWPVLLIPLAALAGGAAAADDIGLSLVYGRSRIDIPASAIERIEAHATRTYIIAETQEKYVSRMPYVEVCYTADIQEQICRLTRQIVERPMSIVVDCQIISEPVVREPLCNMPCFQIPASNIVDANALAQRLKKGSNRRCAPVS